VYSNSTESWLPKAEQHAPEWQAAAEVLMLIGEHGLR